MITKTKTERTHHLVESGDDETKNVLVLWSPSANGALARIQMETFIRDVNNPGDTERQQYSGHVTFSGSSIGNSLSPGGGSGTGSYSWGSNNALAEVADELVLPVYFDTDRTLEIFVSITIEEVTTS